jgi:hypothetical protein
MELSWLTRIKATAVLVMGIVIWGVPLWHFVTLDDPMDAVTLFGHISALHIGMTIGIAFAMGFTAYFISWPYGREIGVLAVPAGLAAWAVRSGDMTELMRTHADISQRHNLYQLLGWEGIVWFAIAAAGYGGVMIAAKLIPSSGAPVEIHPPTKESNSIVQGIFAIIAAVAIAAIGITLFAKDVVFNDKVLKTVLGQPSTAQIAFAALVAFGLAAFVIKQFWNASYIWSVIATVVVSCGVMNLAAKKQVLEYMADNWPINFFPQPAYAILPIQIVSFGIIGAVIGYWLAVRYTYWRTHCSK